MSSGPITLFDKSFIQSLSLDESVWFDHFYYTVVCPIFYVETLADLSKQMPEGRSAEKEVAKIADKFPEMSGNPCMEHSELCLGNLLGNPVSMDGRIMMRGGVPVDSGGRRGFVFKAPPETKAFNRWQQGRFKELEADYARKWRHTVSTLDLTQASNVLAKFDIDSTGCKSLKDAYNLANKIVSAERAYDQMALAVLFLQIPQEYHQQVVQLWQLKNLCPISSFAPYASFVLKVELFFQIAVAAGLIAATRPSNRVDIAYLFYLPFCMVFVSSDKLHQRCAPLFLRPDQDFVWGLDLKQDLAALNERYSKLDNVTKEQGVMSFASTPPQADESLTTTLWDHHLTLNWRDRKEVQTERPASNKELVNELNQFNEATPLSADEVDFDADSADAMSMQRMVRKQKGRWLLVPKDLEEDGS